MDKIAKVCSRIQKHINITVANKPQLFIGFIRQAEFKPEHDNSIVGVRAGIIWLDNIIDLALSRKSTADLFIQRREIELLEVSRSGTVEEQIDAIF